MQAVRWLGIQVKLVPILIAYVHTSINIMRDVTGLGFRQEYNFNNTIIGFLSVTVLYLYIQNNIIYLINKLVEIVINDILTI